MSVCTDCRAAGRENQMLGSYEPGSSDHDEILAFIQAAHQVCVHRNGPSSTWCDCHHETGKWTMDPVLAKHAAVPVLPGGSSA
jgi:hypothetical protein